MNWVLTISYSKYVGQTHFIKGIIGLFDILYCIWSSCVTAWWELVPISPVLCCIRWDRLCHCSLKITPASYLLLLGERVKAICQQWLCSNSNNTCGAQECVYLSSVAISHTSFWIFHETSTHTTSPVQRHPLVTVPGNTLCWFNTAWLNITPRLWIP